VSSESRRWRGKLFQSRGNASVHDDDVTFSHTVVATTSAPGLHWLRVFDRITFRLAVLNYCCLHSSVPEYLSRQLQRVSDVHTRQRLHSSSWLFCGPIEPTLAAEVSLLLRPQSGTACQKQSVLQHLQRFQKVIKDGTVHAILC